MSVAEMGWDEAQAYWREKFAEKGWAGVRLLTGLYYIRKRERGEILWLSDSEIAPSKLAWMVQQGLAEGVDA